jgi:hypothetical protein
LDQWRLPHCNAVIAIQAVKARGVDDAKAIYQGPSEKLPGSE